MDSNTVFQNPYKPYDVDRAKSSHFLFSLPLSPLPFPSFLPTAGRLTSGV